MMNGFLALDTWGRAEISDADTDSEPLTPRVVGIIHGVIIMVDIGGDYTLTQIQIVLRPLGRWRARLMIGTSK